MKFLILTMLCLFAAANAFDLDEYEQLIIEMSKNQTLVDDFEKNVRDLLTEDPDYFDYTPFKSQGMSFNCKVETSPQKPTSVHQLRPSDIDVVAAMGDSLTAALGSNARTILGLLLEYRGKSWSVGGDQTLEKLVSLPNILKKFNPKIKGFSTGKDISLLTKTGKGLNAAVSGQEANHIPEQARVLIERLRGEKTVDFNNDWKMITLFVGGNDLCRYCKDPAKHSAQAYVDDIRRGLDLLYKEVPRAFINVVTVLRVQEVKLLNKGLICKALHKWGCKCAAYPETPADEKSLDDLTHSYQQLIEDLVNSDRYNGREDFTVVVQPFLKEMSIPKNAKGEIDFGYFAPDCFHFSSKGHSSAAVGLWNNLLQPIGRKDTTWHIGETLNCPTSDHPYLFTKRN